MDPLSRSMRIVRLAQQQVAEQLASTSDEGIETFCEGECSTPQNSPNEPQTNDTSLDISVSELLPTLNSDDILSIEPNLTHDNSFSCYFPTENKKENILTQGNVITNSKHKYLTENNDSFEMVPLNNITDNDCVDMVASDMIAIDLSLNVSESVCDNVVESKSTNVVASVASNAIDHAGLEVPESTGLSETAGFISTPSFGSSIIETVRPSASHTYGLSYFDSDGPNCDESARTNVADSIRHIDGESTNRNVAEPASENIDKSVDSQPNDSDANDENSTIPTMALETVNTSYVNSLNTVKKRKADETKWIKVVNKNKRQKGEIYLGRKYEKESKKFEVIEKPSKVLGERCQCKSAGMKCAEVTDDERKKIFEQTWTMTWEQRKVLANSLVTIKDVSRHRVTQSTRQNTMRYNLNVGSEYVPVCKKMFLSTTGMTKAFVRSHSGRNDDTEDRQLPKTCTSTKRDDAKRFLASIPSMPSHYCRKSSSKKYFDRSFSNKMDVYNAFVKWCQDQGISEIASRQVLCDEMDEGNFAIFQPRKDQCDLCVSFEEGNMDEQAYDLHRQKKEAAQAAKTADKILAADSNGKIKMITVDLQAVLLSPALKASALYYRTKLCVHNYTIFDTTTRDVCCYVWHEVEGGLTANEFASCLSDYISKVGRECNHLIVYSDGCPYQNRNVTLSKTLTFCAQMNNITITHKYLEKGHTQMEVDSVHHVIETKIKNKAVYSPSDYVRLFKEARKNPTPYRVEYLDHSFFKNFTGVCSLKTIRPGKKAGDPQVVDIRCLQYESDGRILFKLTHNDDWKELCVRGNSTKTIAEPHTLLTAQRRLTNAKFNHLQELKVVIPRDLHSFYDSLPHE